MKNIITYFLILLFSISFASAGEEKIIHKAESDFGPVWVFELGKTRCMSFIKPPTGVVQSCFDKQNPNKVLLNYAKMILSTVLHKKDPQKILVIGLGGATIANALNILVPDANIDVVEINPQLPAVAKDYFNFKEGGKNKLFTEDGIKFIENSEDNKYDIVILDAFDTEYVPKGFLTDELMQHSKRILKMNGVIALNTFVNNKHNDIEKRLFDGNFISYYRLVKDGNKILVSSNWNLKSYENLLENSVSMRDKFNQIGVDVTNLLSLYKNSLNKK